MQRNFSIGEILTAVNDLQNIKKEKKVIVKKVGIVKKESSNIPVNTLRLIEEAEKIKS